MVRHCLYGVDLNETAVELCKVALWMETLEPGKPLSFLDKNIQVGNSLLGVTPGLDIEEIPDDAFQPKTGDDKTTAAGLRRRNKKEREGQLGFLFGDQEPQGVTERFAAWRARHMATLDAQAEDALDQVAAKEAAYAEYLSANQYLWGRLENDLWTAAFFWPIPAGDPGALPAPTQQVLRDLRSGKTQGHERVLERVRTLAKRHKFFHWALQFPDVFQGAGSREVGSRDADSPLPTANSLFPRSPGFDVVLSNPPWEHTELKEKEFFASRRPDIAEARTGAERKRMIDALAEEDPALYREFVLTRRDHDGIRHFVRNSSRFPLCGRGRINTYAVFAELARQVLSPAGRSGVIVPTGIATDDTTKFFFQDIMQTGSLASLYDFENRRKIFTGIDSRIKFCLLTLRGSREVGSGEIGSSGRGRLPTPDSLLPSPPLPAQFIFFALDVADLQDEERRFTLTAEEIALLNPNTRTCPIFRSKRDAELTKSIYRRVPVLIKEGPPEVNPWGVKFATMFHMSNDSHLFRTRAQLEAEGYRLEGNRFVKGVGSGEIGSSGGSRLPTADSLPPSADVYLPLYEAKMFHHFDHRWATYEGLDTRDVSLDEKRNPSFTVLPRYWVASAAVKNRSQNWDASWNFATRDICRNTDVRTSICGAYPLSAVSGSYLFRAEILRYTNIVGLSANLSSFALDYGTRQKLGGTHLSLNYLKQLPVLPPVVYAQPCPWAPGEDHAAWLLPRVLELTYTAWDLQPFARDVLRAVGSREVGSSGGTLLPTPDSLPPYKWDEERRFLLRCELDAAYFHLYGIERDDVAYILETFPIVKRKDVAKYGEYRTQRVILEIYDELAEAMRSGVPYQTRLDPPPANPRVAHADSRTDANLQPR